MKSRPPLHGYNTNYRREGKVYHVQTEDLGHPASAVVTQVFTGGTILAIRRTPYVEILDDDDSEGPVRNLMRKQHKAMLIGLRDGTLGEDAEPVEEVKRLDDDDFDIVDDGTDLRDTIRMQRPPGFAEALIAKGKAKEAARAAAATTPAETPIDVDDSTAEPEPARASAPPPIPGDAMRPPSQPNLPAIEGAATKLPVAAGPKKTIPLFSMDEPAHPPPTPTKRRTSSVPPSRPVSDDGAPVIIDADDRPGPRAPRIFSEVSKSKAGRGEAQLGERSLDEVILSAHAEDLQDD